MKGIVLAGGRATRLSPASRATSKQLMHVYDKPLVYYPISTLLHARINQILVISTPEQIPLFEALLGDGSQWGCRFEYAVQPEPNGIAAAFLIGEEFIGEDDVALVLGDNIFYGWHLGEQLQDHTDPDGAVVFGLWVPDPERYGVLELDSEGNVLAIHEKPIVAPSNYMIPGLYFYDNSVVEVAKHIQPSTRGELEISEVNSHYLAEGRLEVCRLPFSTEWFDVGTFDALLDAQTWVGAQQHRKGLLIGAPETAAYREGFISGDQLRALAAAADQGEDLMKSGYGDLLLRFLEFEPESKQP
ncbi:MAG TPA: sugar phosphate nucleotidyltransferase [Acidimicrobiales bacterium]|nr:sugar phosphate nucleotidyltransferase [Acidimicrobiales bacterium]